VDNATGKVFDPDGREVPMSIGLSVAALLALLWWEVGGPPWRISPDGQYYLQAGAPRPYGLRWLLHGSAGLTYTGG